MAFQSATGVQSVIFDDFNKSVALNKLKNYDLDIVKCKNSFECIFVRLFLPAKFANFLIIEQVKNNQICELKCIVNLNWHNRHQSSLMV